MRTRTYLAVATTAVFVLLLPHDVFAVAPSVAQRATARDAPSASSSGSSVDRLRVRMRTLRRRLAAQRSRAVALDRRAVDLERTLDTRTAERDDAVRQAALLRARASAIPSALERAVEQVRREVAYSQLVLRSTDAAPSREALVAHAAMSYVVGHVTAPGYGYMNVIAGTRPTPTPNGVLEVGSGICGHAALTFAAIVKRFGLPVRSVQLWYENGSGHIAAEVFYDGAWHYYDPTFGAYYSVGGRVLSIGEARAHPEGRSLLRHDATLFWYRVALLAGVDYLAGEPNAATRVEIDQQPFTG